MSRVWYRITLVFFLFLFEVHHYKHVEAHSKHVSSVESICLIHVMASDLFCMPCDLSSTTQRLARPRSHRHLGDRTSVASYAKFLNGTWHPVICAASTQPSTTTQSMENRRSANYQPNLWSFEFLQSLENHHAVETLQEGAVKLEEKVRSMINNRTDMEPLSLLELIDDVQRLGLSYKFDKDIKRALHCIVSLESSKDKKTQKSLHAIALLFRILRQHGFDVPQDVFESFKDEEGNYKAEISDDVRGMISLYQASHLTFEGESLWEAKEFSRRNLMNLTRREETETKVAENVRRILEALPYHQSPYRLQARRNIDTYDKKEPHNCLLLELAKLEFNMVQSLHQQELQEMSRWWRDIGLASKLSFARDRLTESFFWSLGIVSEPQFTNCRKQLTKVVALITVLDDVYDVYGTLDELELFTDAVERWDVNAINTLPDYMTLCFLALYNTVNEMAYDIFKEQGVKCLPYLIKAWSDLFKSFLQEAKWSRNKVTPSFNEYLGNAWLSSSGGVLLIHSYFLLSQDITEQALHSLANYHDPLRSSSTVFRLCNDLATSADEMKFGDSTNSIKCYMHETGDSEENARRYLRTLIDKAWQKMNKCLVMDSTFPKAFIVVAMNLARIAQCTYQYGDGHGRPDNISKSRIRSLLVDPIPVN